MITFFGQTFQPLTVILFGSAGSGKGTQGDFLISALHLVKLEAGELVREKAREDSPFGRYVKEVHESGKYLSDEEITRLVEEKITRVPRDRGLLIDGYPRRIGQAKMLEEALQRIPRTNVKALVIEVDEEELKRRLLNRSVCVNGHILIGRDYDRCPTCGGAVVVRDYDQNEEAIMKRITFYREEVVPAIEYYRQKGWVVEVNGEQSVEEVRKEIFRKLGIE
ncbi:MAG: nucleoside monophosphate kinase [Patescibacteria group bacterium]